MMRNGIGNAPIRYTGNSKFSVATYLARMEDVPENEDHGLLATRPADGGRREQSGGKLSDSAIASSTALSSPSLHLTDHINFEVFSRIMEDFSEHRAEASGGGGGDSTANPLQNAKLAAEDFQKVMSDLLGRLPDDPKIVLLCKKVRQWLVVWILQNTLPLLFCRSMQMEQV